MTDQLLGLLASEGPRKVAVKILKSLVHSR